MVPLPRPPADELVRPDVIVDFDCREGMLFIVLKNIGVRSAYDVTTRFDKPLVGLEGRKRISDLQLFKNLAFIPPGKEFSQFVDAVDSWFKRRQPSKIKVTITYRDRERRAFTETILHDLRIYKDLGWVRTSISGANDEHFLED